MKPAVFRRLFNLWPPFLCSGIRMEVIDPQWRHARVRLKLRWYNRNYVGTQFGGSLFAMTDPFWMILLMERLGRDYIVWDKAAEIEFVSPGRSDVVAEFALDEATVDAVRAAVQRDGKTLHWFDTEVRSADDGTLVARVRKQVYVRRKRREALPDQSR